MRIINLESRDRSKQGNINKERYAGIYNEKIIIIKQKMKYVGRPDHPVYKHAVPLNTVTSLLFVQL